LFLIYYFKSSVSLKEKETNLESLKPSTKKEQRFEKQIPALFLVGT
jgi:hypothetical protein